MSHLPQRRQSAGRAPALGEPAATHLAPQQFSDANEQTPKPLREGELRAAEGFTPKFHNENLEPRKEAHHQGGESRAASPPAETTNTVSAPRPVIPVGPGPICLLEEEKEEIQSGEEKTDTVFLETLLGIQSYLL